MSRTSRGAALVALALVATPAVAAKLSPNLLQKLAAYARQTDVQFQPPTGAPSPMIGSFLIRADRGIDPKNPKLTAGELAQVGRYDAAMSQCATKFATQDVASSEKRTELVSMETGVGVNLGIPYVDLGGSWGRKSMGGLDYALTSKRVLTGESLQDAVACCVANNSACPRDDGQEHVLGQGYDTTVIAEWWQGVGSVYRLTQSNAAITAAVKQLQQLGQAQFKNSSSWQMQSEWATPQWFAYRTQKLRVPSCEEFMNSSPELADKVRFTGVSEFLRSESASRSAARDDARKQVVEYLGTEFQIVQNDAIKVAEAVISGVKDDLTCVQKGGDPTGPAYLARTRLYVDKARLEAAAADMRSGLSTPPPPPAPVEAAPPKKGKR